MSKTANDTDKLCALCGEEFHLNDGEEAYRDEDDDEICDECYHDHYEFTCCACQNYGHVADRHNMVVVFDIDGTGLPSDWKPGLFLITRFPYVTTAMLGPSWLHQSSLERIGDIPAGARQALYMCGHLCMECQHKATTCKLPRVPDVCGTLKLQFPILEPDPTGETHAPALRSRAQA